MVAELADISTVTVDSKTSPSVCTLERRKRAKWIRTATREPIYSVLDSDECLPPNIHGKVVVISAVRNNKSRRKSPKRASPIVHEIEDVLYSVVRKPKKVRLSEALSAYEEAIRPVNETRIEDTTERAQQLGDPEASRRVEVRKRLSDTPRQTFPQLVMYADRGEYENPWHSDHREDSVAMSRGVVGLVGPYRVYGNPNEKREYMLQEEELVEEVVDSASERITQRDEGVKEEHRQRAKWKIREDDEKTLVPDIRDLPSLEMKSNDERTNEWKEERRSTAIEKSGSIERILSGKEERAVDVPDTVSAVLTANKWGETSS